MRHSSDFPAAAGVLADLREHDGRTPSFETGYRAELPRRFRTLRTEYGGSYEKFLDDLRSRVPGTRPSDLELMEVYAYAAAYSADEDGTVRLPFDSIGAIVPEVWRRSPGTRL